MVLADPEEMETKPFEDRDEQSPPSSPVSEHGGNPVRSPTGSTHSEVDPVPHEEKKDGTRPRQVKQEASTSRSEVNELTYLLTKF